MIMHHYYRVFAVYVIHYAIPHAEHCTPPARVQHYAGVDTDTSRTNVGLKHGVTKRTTEAVDKVFVHLVYEL